MDIMNDLACEVYVDQYLARRVADPSYPPEACRIAWITIRAYRQAIRRKDWSQVIVLGEMLLQIAKAFRDEPDCPDRFFTM